MDRCIPALFALALAVPACTTPDEDPALAERPVRARRSKDSFGRDIHVSYTVGQASPGTLRVHYASGPFGKLTVQDVDAVSSDLRTSLALDRNDRPHLAYPQPGVLMYAERTGTSWAYETASSHPMRPGHEVAVAVDRGLRVVASHMRDDSFETGFWPPYAGARELVVSMRAPTWQDTLRRDWWFGDEHVHWSLLDTSVAFDREDRGHLAFVRTFGMEPGSGLFYTREDRTSGWGLPNVPVVVPKAPEDQFGVLHIGRAQIALTTRGAPHIIYTTWEVIDGPAPYKCFIKHVTGVPDAPVHTILAPLNEDVPPMGREPGLLQLCAHAPRNRPAITTDDNDVVHVAYWDNGNPPLFQDAGLWYARLKDGVWQRELVDPIAAIDHVSIAVNHLGIPVIAYREDERGNPYQVKLAARIGGDPWAFHHIADEAPLVELGDVAVTGSRGRSNR
jgi:hypothetical protein